MITRPTSEQIETAAEWLRIIEGEEGEADACRAVAAWILALDDDHRLRLVARNVGVTITRLRRMLKEREAAKAL